MFKAVKKIGWNRDGIEVEVVRRYRFNGNGRNGRNGRSVEAEAVKQNVEMIA